MQSHEEIVQSSLSEIPECVAAWIADPSGNVRAKAAENGAEEILTAIEDACAIATRAAGWHEKAGGIMSLGLNEEILQTTTKYMVLTRYYPRLEYTHTVVIRKSGNAGFARIKMKLYADAFRRRQA